MNSLLPKCRHHGRSLVGTRIHVSPSVFWLNAYIPEPSHRLFGSEALNGIHGKPGITSPVLASRKIIHVEICVVASTVSGGGKLFTWLGISLDQKHLCTGPGRFNGSHHPCRAGTYHRHIHNSAIFTHS